MIFLQATTGVPPGSNYVMLLGTLGMVSLTLGIVFFVIFHQRKVNRFNLDLKKLEELLIDSDAGVGAFADIMLYHRNQNWVEKLKSVMPNHSVVIAVGAGHLPGEKGVINLLRKEGYKVSPVDNTIKRSKEI